jgi:hypothetical protein
MTPITAAATIQRIADSGLDISTENYRALVEVAQWLAALPKPQPVDWAKREEYHQSRYGMSYKAYMAYLSEGEQQ